MDINLNRARLLHDTLPYTITNTQTFTLASGAVVSVPMVALAYSYAMLRIEGGTPNTKVSITCNGIAVTLTLNADGDGAMSLTPFIRAAIQGNGTLANPLYTSGIRQGNGFRGSMVVIVTEPEELPLAVSVSYILGNYAPKGERVTDLYFDYDANGESWASYDDAANYNAGTPIAFDENWCDMSELVAEEPTGDFDMVLPTAWFYGSKIHFSEVTYHFRYDCRTEGMAKVRWLDTNGNLNERKFVIAGKQHGASTSATWHTPHDEKSINLGYYAGRDQWRERSASEVMVVGDDCIPITHFDWLKTIASAPVAEVFLDGVWVKCEIADMTTECDPRKSLFSITLNLVLPTDDVQQL